MILVDTSVLIDFFKGAENLPTMKFHQILANSIPFGITSMIYQEVLQGAKDKSEFNKLKKYLGSQKLFEPVDPRASYEEAAEMYFRLREKGITVRSAIDCLIVQIAKENDLMLLNNDRDFNPICKFAKVNCY